MTELGLLIIGWLLGLLSSLGTGLVLFWLEGKRIERNELMKKRESNLRIALNWASSDKKISLRGFDLVAADLSGVDLSSADLTDADFSRASLNGTRFYDAKLCRAIFRKAYLSGTDFRFADLTRADFSGTNIADANFDNAKLKGVKFIKSKGINDNQSWMLSKVDETTELPEELLKELLQFQNLAENHPEELMAILEQVKDEQNSK